MIEQLLAFPPLWIAGAAVVAMPVLGVWAAREPRQWRHDEPPVTAPKPVAAAVAAPVKVTAVRLHQVEAA